MEKQALPVLLICIAILALDLYIFPRVRFGLKKWRFAQKKAFKIIYWTLSTVVTLGIFISIFARTGLGFRAAFMLVFFLMTLSKLLFLPFALSDDIRRLIKWYRIKSQSAPPAE